MESAGLKAVIFDMDGLLFDTENMTIPLWDEAAKKFGYRIPQNVVIKTIGISSKKSRVIMLEEFGEDFPYDEIQGEFRKIVKREFEKHGIPKKKGLDFLLEKLYAAKIPMSLATSTRRETALYMLDKAGVLDRFTAVTGGDEVENGKPAPDIFLLAAKKVNTPPSACVGFEDSPAGLRALNAAGIRSVFIKDIIIPSDEVLATVWHRCNDLGEAARVLGLAG